MPSRRQNAPNAALAAKFQRALRPFPPTDRYLVGVSGGRDSVALLHLLREAGYERLVVCHLDHRMRPESARDAEFVADLARSWKYPVVVENADVPTLARSTKTSRETAARNARRAFFAAVSKRRRCGRLFLAHHADDQVETFLYRLLRGAGATGLSAMRPDSPLSASVPLRLLRPLLGVWRAEIDAYVRTHSLPFREDLSNADQAHARNRIRAKVLPMLDHEMGRSVRPALWRAAEVLGAEDAWIGALLQADAPLLGPYLAVQDLQAQPLARQRRTVRQWLCEQDAPGSGFEEVDLILSLLDISDGPAKVNLSGGWHARRREGTLFLQSPGDKPSK